MEIVAFSKVNFRKNYPDILPCVNLKVVFRIKKRLTFKFTFKDKISKEMRSLLCYKFQCSSYSATYYGKTKRHFKIRIFLHVQVKTSSLQKILLCVIIC